MHQKKHHLKHAAKSQLGIFKLSTLSSLLLLHHYRASVDKTHTRLGI